MDAGEDGGVGNVRLLARHRGLAARSTTVRGERRSGVSFGRSAGTNHFVQRVVGAARKGGRREGEGGRREGVGRVEGVEG